MLTMWEEKNKEFTHIYHSWNTNKIQYRIILTYSRARQYVKLQVFEQYTYIHMRKNEELKKKHTENNKYERSLLLVYLRITAKKQKKWKENHQYQEGKFLNFFSEPNLERVVYFFFFVLLISYNLQQSSSRLDQNVLNCTQRWGKTIHVDNYICYIVILNVNTCCVLDTDVLIFLFVLSLFFFFFYNTVCVFL